MYFGNMGPIRYGLLDFYYILMGQFGSDDLTHPFDTPSSKAWVNQLKSKINGVCFHKQSNGPQFRLLQMEDLLSS